ncbi:stage II sporulation protein R [Virgibacillus sp. 179-BFC.A HS]|uniref:Stage II sporulation protein R n=1 Tax=Tigheibacillus jepli TaxID=3035914 RepID=A0ABU5CE50_9BACI|nr:stage II sporulation protein R [Virgibacillus sp. 179-BFC.A HS]MDY0404551.1 stage II sporulation protein R [Virgibacillus sp. 179-BFC.A HS]
MKKLLFFALMIAIIYFTIPKNFGSTTQADAEYQIIPDEAIRLRILANSDEKQDQQIKRLVRDEVNKKISNWVEDISDIDEARKLIQHNIPEIESVVEKTLQKANADNRYTVEYGKNVVFPTKMYGSYVYPAGEYEAVLITLGKGKGANWWCVLFPPLCFLDFSNGTSVAEASVDEPKEEEEVEVKFFLFEWIEKLFA